MLSPMQATTATCKDEAIATPFGRGPVLRTARISSVCTSTQAKLARGQRLVEILKQDQYQPLPVEKQVLIIFAGANRFLDDLDVSECSRFETELYSFMETNYSGVLKGLRERKSFDDSLRAEVSKALGAFKERFTGKVPAPANAPAAAAAD